MTSYDEKEKYLELENNSSFLPYRFEEGLKMHWEGDKDTFFIYFGREWVNKSYFILLNEDYFPKKRFFLFFTKHICYGEDVAKGYEGYEGYKKREAMFEDYKCLMNALPIPENKITFMKEDHLHEELTEKGSKVL